jgi:transcription elongation factor Elf1
MNQLEEWHLSCPYCGENISMLVDCSVPQQTYIEDCQVCCQPIELDVTIDLENKISVHARRDDN